MSPAPPQLESWLRADVQRMQYLQIVRDTLGEDFWLAAGFVRNLVWDRQHGYADTPLDDIDVIYLAAAKLAAAQDEALAAQLRAQLDAPWQVRNQARMAHKHGHAGYQDCAEAISYWPETATCYAVRLDKHEQLHWLAPLGWPPLFSLCITRNPRFSGGDAKWQQRQAEKQWPQRWPQLRDHQQ